MKQIIFLSLLLSCSKIFSQSPAPPLINYQGVARNATGTPIINQTIGIVFELIQGTITGSVSYTETHAITTNSLGLFTTQIGKINSLAGLNWQNGPYFLQISMDASGGTNYIPLGQPQQLVSVPYALYAEKSGSDALPTATLNGTTLRYNSSNSDWVIDTNLLNNGNRVTVGNSLNIKQNKFQSITENGLDSAAIFGYNNFAVTNYAGVRGLATGSSPSTGTNSGIGIFGGHFAGYNVAGTGIGVLGQGSSFLSNGVGLLGIGSSSGTAVNNNYAIGLFATVDNNSTATNKYAAIFDRGGVMVTDSLLLGSLTNPGNIGDILTKTSNNGRGTWMTPLTGSGPFTNSANYIHAASSFTNSRILFGIPFTGSVGYQSRVTIVNPTTISSDTALIVLQKNNTKPAIYASILPSNTSLSPAIFGEVIGGLNGTTAGVYGKANFNHGVIGYSGNFNGVWGQSPNGVGVSGESTGNGQAGRFNLTSSTSSLPAVYIATNSDFGALKAETFGKGATIIAINSCSVGGSNNLSLLLDKGHIGAVGTNINITGTSSNSSSTVTLTSTKVGNSNDVRGLITAIPSFTVILNTNDYVTVAFSFDKSYSNTPYVVITPTNNQTAKLSHEIFTAGPSGCTIKFSNNTISPINLVNIAFNYFVIE